MLSTKTWYACETPEATEATAPTLAAEIEALKAVVDEQRRELGRFRSELFGLKMDFMYHLDRLLEERGFGLLHETHERRTEERYLDERISNVESALRYAGDHGDRLRKIEDRLRRIAISDIGDGK